MSFFDKLKSMFSKAKAEPLAALAITETDQEVLSGVPVVKWAGANHQVVTTLHLSQGARQVRILPKNFENLHKDARGFAELATVPSLKVNLYGNTIAGFFVYGHWELVDEAVGFTGDSWAGSKLTDGNNDATPTMPPLGTWFYENDTQERHEFGDRLPKTTVASGGGGDFSGAGASGGWESSSSDSDGRRSYFDSSTSSSDSYSSSSSDSSSYD